LKYTENMRKGFTLIEILIVVAIIAILASVVLIGLGPTQQSGRDARRLSDLHEAQNAIELYYQKCGFYPGPAGCGTGFGKAPADWSALSTVITGSSIGVNNPLPLDPTTGATYYYGSTDGSSYLIGAHLENVNNSVFNGYQIPTNIPSGFGIDCKAASGNYCISL
jgi:prepilin-type N-terminal cleavage/methylation domain-containing protein